ncbi:DNA-binding transcriptional regulator, MocR family, contains an aminotransferase domain [Chitinophaga rupis]|uniref:DNA-binding transcriptional regulator, MocR family, contains an aminotransferase domain n=2 Tax=Chitinophaga TaxID=79328 RepID=A0A1H7XFJ5_9BACT|nr:MULTISPECIES: PLP-dependent aminotransferase family protein [Chitinophaga]SEM31809.1 DNA-binding transcriptional regulator, MocR family, contains an aminotransferase domain [Chitinophaga rupis]
MLKTAEHLYLQIADRIEQLIEKDVLKIGDKLPSVRMLSKEQGVSLSTAFQAYYHLEGKGLIEPRPKSGYYIRFSPRKLRDIPKTCEPVKKASEVTVHEMIDRVFAHMAADNILKFSIAAAADSLLPAAKISKSMVQALRNMPGNGIGYESIQGNLQLRRQIARMSILWGGVVSEEDVVTTNGCTDALTLSLCAVTQPGDTIALESPSYYGSLQLAASLGLKVLEVPTNPVTGVELDYLDKAIPRHNIKACLFVTNFNNPLGSCMPDTHKRELVHILEKHGIPLIEDDIYGDIYFGRERPALCKTFDESGIVLACNSFSKSLAPGYRVGWTLPGKYKEKVLRLKRNHSIACASLPHAAVAHFLENGRYEHHLRSMRKQLHTQSLRYLQAVADYFPEDTLVTRPMGGFVLWLALNENINTYELYELALKNKISFAPGRIFSLQDRYRNCMRLSYGNPWNKQVEEGIKTLGKLIRKLKG